MNAPQGGLAFPRPGPVVRAVMIAVFAIWLVLALSVNWLELPVMGQLAELLVGSQRGLLRGEFWRLVTAPLVHTFRLSPWHMLNTVLGLYFFGTTLEGAWGAPRFIRFLVATAVLPYLLQALMLLVLPSSLGAKMVAGGIFFGGLPVVEAVAVAWALSFKGRQVLLFFVLPVSSQVLLAMVIGMSVLHVIVAASLPSGLIAPFFGMGLGWLLGAGTPSPLRRAWLRYRLGRLDAKVKAETDREKKRRKAAIARAGLRVIDGGGGGDEGRGPDGGYLN